MGALPPVQAVAPAPPRPPHSQFRAPMTLDTPCQGGLSLEYEHMSCPVHRWATYVPRLPRGSVHPRRPAHHSVCRRRASPRGECATPPVRPPQRVPAPRLPARGACNSAGPPTTACAGAAPPREGSVQLRRFAYPRCTDAAPPREGSVHLRRFAHHSVCRRRASPRGECAPAPVRPPQRVPAPRLPARGVCTCAGSPIQGVPAPRLPARGVCTCAGPPDRACAGARLSARGVCDRVGPPLPGAGRRTPT